MICNVDDQIVLTWPGVDQPIRISSTKPYKALGCMISITGHTHFDITQKNINAWGAFNDLKAFFGLHCSSRRQRFILIERAILPVITFGAGHWLPTVCELRKIRHCQNMMLSKVCRFARFHGETDQNYFARRGTFLKQLKVQLGIVNWDIIVLTRIHTWAGHLCRLRVRDPQRLVLRALFWKDCQEIYTVQLLQGNQGHDNGRMYTRRWEHNFYHYFQREGNFWFDIAVFPKTWFATCVYWCNCRLKPYAGSGVIVDKNFLEQERLEIEQHILDLDYT
jgi:hypothetical protein